MMETYLRPGAQKYLVTPIANQMARQCSANSITLLSLVTGLLVIPALMADLPLLACAALLTSGAFDMLDGSIARLRGESSQMGAVYDIAADRIVEAAVIIGLYLVVPQERGLLCLAMLASVLICVTSFLLAAMIQDNQGEKSFHYSPGLMERAEAFTFFLVMILAPGWFTPLAVLFTLLVLLTGVIRIYELRKSVANAASEQS